jgi:hypothetical protein
VELIAVNMPDMNWQTLPSGPTSLCFNKEEFMRVRNAISHYFLGLLFLTGFYCKKPVRIINAYFRRGPVSYRSSSEIGVSLFSAPQVFSSIFLLCWWWKT